ncbi:MAG TPA: CPBP family intramembrane glutamic endopeptidase [Parvibaculum sp.]|jgi:hypothetical protein
MDAEADREAAASAAPGESAYRLRDAVFLLAAYIGAQLVAALVYMMVLFWRFGTAQGAALMKTGDGLNRIVVVSCAACSLAVIAAFWRFARRRGVTLRGFGFVWPARRWLWITPVMFVAIQGLLSLFSVIAGDEVARQGLETMNGVRSSDPRWNVASAFLFVLVIPVLEEAIFRVVLFRALARRMPAIAAACLSVAVFVAMHVQYTLAGGAVAVLMTAEVTLLGAALMWLYMKSGSIWPSVAVHVANNGFALLSLLIGF